MATIIKRIGWIYWYIFSVSLSWASIDKEIIVLFKTDVIKMPIGKDTANLNGVIVDSDVKDCLIEINAIKINKAIPDFNRADTVRISEDGRVVKLPDWSNLYVIEVAGDRDSAIVKLERLGKVVYAEKNTKAEPLYTTPNDKWFHRQWNLNDPTGEKGIDVMRAWDLSRGSNSVIIGIIDDGVRTEGPYVHEDLVGKVFGDTSYSTHGTQVAGIAAALTNNNKGIAGVDWYALLNIQDYGGGSVPELAQAIYQAVNAGAKIINCSWAFSYAFNQTVYDAPVWAYQLNRLIVTAMPAQYNSRSFPSAYGPWIFTVAATDKYNRPATYRLERHWVDVAAPGGEEGDFQGIMSPFSYNAYRDDHCGTSFAAPHISGIAGLMLAANPSLYPYDIEWIIKYCARDTFPWGFDSITGYGLAKAYESVKRVLLPYEITRGSVPITKVAENVLVHFDSKSILPYFFVLDAGRYVCDIYMAKIELNFSTPYAERPWCWLSLIGYNFGNYPDKYFWMYKNVTTTSATIATYFYFLKKDFWGNNVYKYIPVDPNLIPLQYVVLGRRPINTPTNLQATEIS